MMVLTLKEIKIVMTMMVVAAITSQVPTVHEEFEESFWETETSDLGREQYTGVCQTPQALGNNRSAQSLHQTPTFPPCVYTCLFLSHAAQVQMVLWSSPSPYLEQKKHSELHPSWGRVRWHQFFLPSGVYYVLWLLRCVLSHNSLPHLLILVPYYVLSE